MQVDGVRETDPDRWIDPERARVSVDGKPLGSPRKVYLLLYKPKGYHHDREGSEWPSDRL